MVQGALHTKGIGRVVGVCSGERYAWIVWYGMRRGSYERDELVEQAARRSVLLGGGGRGLCGLFDLGDDLDAVCVYLFIYVFFFFLFAVVLFNDGGRRRRYGRRGGEYRGVQGARALCVARAGGGGGGAEGGGGGGGEGGEYEAGRE